MKTGRSFAVLFSIIMLLFVLFIAWYLPAICEVRFQLDDVGKSLETSRGRERKQQYEYDKVVAAIPEVQAELDSILPLSESAAEEVKKLRAERKQLRDKKTELEAGKKTDTAEGDQSHE